MTKENIEKLINCNIMTMEICRDLLSEIDFTQTEVTTADGEIIKPIIVDSVQPINECDEDKCFVKDSIPEAKECFIKIEDSIYDLTYDERTIALGLFHENYKVGDIVKLHIYDKVVDFRIVHRTKGRKFILLSNSVEFYGIFSNINNKYNTSYLKWFSDNVIYSGFKDTIKNAMSVHYIRNCQSKIIIPTVANLGCSEFSDSHTWDFFDGKKYIPNEWVWTCEDNPNNEKRARLINSDGTISSDDVTSHYGIIFAIKI